MYEIALQILKKINSNNYEGYIVGGFSRNKYMNLSSSDIDICTSANPDELKKIFPSADLKNSKYGNVLLNISDYIFEITTFRKDFHYIDNRKPSKIVFVKTLIEDLYRRDFVMNTLCINEKEEFIDMLKAKDDIDNKIIRIVGTKEKLKEDSLRILRAIRVSTELNFNLDFELSEGIKEYGYLIKKLSYTRKKQELDKIFKSSNRKKGIELLLKFKLEKYLDLSNLNRVNFDEDYLSIWKQLDVLNIYPFTKEERKIIVK